MHSRSPSKPKSDAAGRECRMTGRFPANCGHKPIGPEAVVRRRSQPGADRPGLATLHDTAQPAIGASMTSRKSATTVNAPARQFPRQAGKRLRRSLSRKARSC